MKKTKEFKALINRVKDNPTVLYLFERELKKNAELYGDAELDPRKLSIEQFNNRYALLVSVEKEVTHLDRLKGHANLFANNVSKKHKLSSDSDDEPPLSSDKENACQPPPKKMKKASIENIRNYSESFVVPISEEEYPKKLNVRDQNPDATYESKFRKLTDDRMHESTTRKISFPSDEVLRKQLETLRDIRKGIGANPFNVGTHNPTGKIVIRDPSKITTLIPRPKKQKSL